MIVAVVSGKGGTGKTTVSTALALAWSGRDPLTLADCDVEGPNAQAFIPGLGPLERSPIEVFHPVIDATRCQLCGACARFCNFGALAALPDQMMFVESQCHACGGCAMICPLHAIREARRRVGELRRGRAGGLAFVQGSMDVGFARATSVVDATVQAAIEQSSAGGDLILDGPPGACCSVAAVVAAADICLLVTEPTPFGLHDLERVHRLIQLRQRPMAVVLNRARGDGNDQPTEQWCQARDLPLLLKIPDRRDVAEAYAAGEPPLAGLDGLGFALENLRPALRDLLARSIRESA